MTVAAFPGGPARAWLLAIRPKTLPAAVAPVVVGTALAIDEGAFAAFPALVALAVALLLQVAANLANDVFDFRRGADAPGRTGPPRVTQSGLIPPERVMAATGATVGLAVALGTFLVWRGGWPVLLAGCGAVVAAVAYTGGPYPLAYHGLGEPFVFLFFGLVGVAGAYYVQALELTWRSVALAAPIGFLATAILVVNNLRDIATDRAAGKRTIAVRLGRVNTIVEYRLLVAGAYGVVVIAWWVGWLGDWWWLPAVSLPLAASLVWRVATPTGGALNRLLADTARFEVLFSVLLAGAIVA